MFKRARDLVNYTVQPQFLQNPIVALQRSLSLSMLSTRPRFIDNDIKLRDFRVAAAMPVPDDRTYSTSSKHDFYIEESTPCELQKELFRNPFGTSDYYARKWPI